MNYASYYTNYQPTQGDLESISSIETATMGIMATVLTLMLIVFLGVYVVLIIANWKIFTKAGEGGWKSIIPVYNLIIQFKIAGLNPLLVLIYLGMFLPYIGTIVAVVMNIILMIYLAKAFGKGGGFTVGLILLGPIFQCILAFGKSEYLGTTYEKIEQNNL